jgi:PAS domain S-box-containing protein
MQREEQFLAVANLLPESMVLLSADGTIAAVNRAFAERLGAAPASLRGRRLQELTTDPPEDVARYLRDCSRSRQLVLGALRLSAGPLSGIWRSEGAVYRPRSDGEPALLLLRLLPREDVVHRFLLLNQRIDELNREINRRRRAEDALRDQWEWLRVTLESIGDAVIATDTQGWVTFLNPVAQGLTGWTQEEAVRRPLTEIFNIVNEETRQLAENPVAKVLREGTVAGLANHTVLVSRDGREIPIDDCAAPIRDAEGNVLGVVMVFHDVVESRRLERELSLRAERLAEADRRKDEFLAMLAHELRNPLAPIRNALYLLGTPGVNPESLERAREMMARQIQHMVRLVDDLLDVSRITRGKVELRKQPVDLTGLVRRAAEAAQPQVAAKRQDLRVSLPAEPVLLEVDPIRFDQVIMNLINNAMKFTDPGGRIEITLARQEGGVRISVRDTGIGIEPELLSQIFDPFTQGNHSLDRAQGGLGIGLTLVRSLVEMHGGTVAAHSAGRGQGSELVVFLPDGLAAGAETPEPGSPDSRAASLTRRVLVVDDNWDSAETIALVVQLWGHETRITHDGPAALEAALSWRPEVVLLDIGLPRMDGYEVARRLRALDALGGVKLVAMTGYGGEEDRRRSREAGFDHHLVKPVDPGELQALLNGL